MGTLYSLLGFPSSKKITVFVTELLEKKDKLSLREAKFIS